MLPPLVLSSQSSVPPFPVVTARILSLVHVLGQRISAGGDRDPSNAMDPHFHVLILLMVPYFLHSVLDESDACLRVDARAFLYPTPFSLTSLSVPFPSLFLHICSRLVA